MIPQHIANYFASLETQALLPDSIVNRVAKEHPGRLKFLLYHFKDENKFYPENQEIRDKIIKKIEENQSLLERLPLEIKNRIFTFLAYKDLEQLAKASTNLQDAVKVKQAQDIENAKEERRIAWINEHDGKIFDLRLSLDLNVSHEYLKTLLTKHGRKIPALKIIGRSLEKDADLIPELLKCCPNLTHLSITESKIRIKELAGEIGKLPLRRLDLSDNLLGDDAVAILMSEVCKITTLQSLILNNNQIGDRGLADFGPNIGKLASLLNLDLSVNKIGDAGLKAFAPAVGKLANLRYFDLGFNQIGDLGASALAPALGNLVKLRRLDFTNNQVGDDGAMALASEIGKLDNLQEFYLKWNQIRDKGAIALAPQIGKLPNLRQFDIDKNEIKLPGKRSLVLNLEKLGEIEDMVFVRIRL